MEIILDKDKKELLESIDDYTSNLIEAIPIIIKNCREQKSEAVNFNLIDLSDGLIWLNDAIKLTFDIHNIEMFFLTGVCEDLIEAMMNKDYFLIADILEYELMSAIEKINGIITKIIADVE